MAAKSKSVAVIGKHIVNGFRSRASPRAVASSPFASRNGHTSAYDKNVEEELQSSKVPDELVQPDSGKYWSPHPQTGVFGPSSSSSSTDTTGDLRHRGGLSDGGDSMVPSNEATSIEDMDKTHHS